MPILLIVASEGAAFLSHREAIGLAAKARGYDVVVACPADASRDRILAAGFRHAPISLRRGIPSPPAEIAAVWSIYRAISAVRPDLVHLLTSKPIIYGGIAARLMNVPSISAITGLGYVFTGDSFKRRLLRRLAVAGYGAAVNHRASHVIFQNSDDHDTFSRLGLTRHASMSMIPGAGVDLRRITPRPLDPGRPVVILPARLVRDKGVEEFVTAARMLKARGIDATFRLLGDPDPLNPTSIPLDRLQAWEREGVVEWHRHTADIDAALGVAHLVVLPSYREGFPKTLIDAAAAGRAAAASDVPGCRDAIVEGVTGVLFRPRDAAHLAETIQPLIADRQALTRMGANARQHAVDNFDINLVVEAHMRIYDACSHRLPDSGLTAGKS